MIKLQNLVVFYKATLKGFITLVFSLVLLENKFFFKTMSFMGLLLSFLNELISIKFIFSNNFYCVKYQCVHAKSLQSCPTLCDLMD